MNSIPTRIAIFAVLLILVVSFGEQGFMKYSQLRRMKQEIREENRQLVYENDELSREIELLKDEEYLERWIRSELGYLGSDELIFEFD